MAEEFSKAVSHGIHISKRLYFGKDDIPTNLTTHITKPPKRQLSMEKHQHQHENLPTSPMMYAVITNPSFVDNPDVRSYQPYVHGRCNPPALIPLHLYGIHFEVECWFDLVFVTFKGTWRLHCVDCSKQGRIYQVGLEVSSKIVHIPGSAPGSKLVHCLLALLVGQQGSVLGFEVEASSGSYSSQLVKVEDTVDLDKMIKADNGGFLNPDIFTLKIPKVDGGSKVSVKARWSQKLIYREGRLCLSLPFSFPAYVTPVGKFMSSEKILLNVNSGETRTEALHYSASHILKELRRENGKFCFSYESEGDTWSKSDFEFSYMVSSNDIHGKMLVQTPSANDLDQREMFTFCLFPGYPQNCKVFRKRVVFLVDISGSMTGAPLENVKQAVLGTLSKFNQDDSFNIIAYNSETYMLSSSMKLATQEALDQARVWFSSKLLAGGDTNIMLPMKQAVEMVSHERDAISYIFLVTDGAVENEKDICNIVKDSCMKKQGPPSPRICTFGIGSYCNHYFLRMLAQIGKGHYDAAYDADSVALRLEKFLTVYSSVILSNIEVDCLDHAESLTLFPTAIQDLSCDCPVILSGRYKGKLPECLKVRATLADMSSFTTSLKIQEAKDVTLDKVYARTQIDELTAVAWFTGSTEVEKQVAEISMQTGLSSEYTRMILIRAESGDQGLELITLQGKEANDKTNLEKMIRSKKLFPLQSLGVGFGDLKKTAQNLSPGVTVKTPDATDVIVKAATGCCHQFLDRFCCMCCIQLISKMSDRLVITLSQICTALACCECLNCCYDLCDNCC